MLFRVLLFRFVCFGLDRNFFENIRQCVCSRFDNVACVREGSVYFVLERWCDLGDNLVAVVAGIYIIGGNWLVNRNKY